MIKSTQQLGAAELTALEKLITACRDADGNSIATYNELLINHRPKPSSLLLFHQNQLIGFAAAFFFEHDTAEISLLIHPSFRKQTFGTTLLCMLLRSLQEIRPVNQIVFSAPHDRLENICKHYHLQYHGSEFEMVYQAKEALPISNAHIRIATVKDMNILCSIDQRCFPTTHSYSEFRFRTLLARENHIIFVLLQDKQIIGKAHIAWDQHAARLSDIAIIPEMQHQGFGKTLIKHCINFSLTIPRTKITLSVETNNVSALHLYQNLGFSVYNAIDYWQASFQHFCLFFVL